MRNGRKKGRLPFLGFSAVQTAKKKLVCLTGYAASPFFRPEKNQIQVDILKSVIAGRVLSKNNSIVSIKQLSVHPEKVTKTL